jgi:hypothetical protein
VKLSLLLLALLGAGCATAGPVVRVYPDEPNAVWRAGRGIVEREVNGARVAVAFDRQDEDRLVFRVEVENTGADRFDVEPKNVGYIPCVGDKCQRMQPVADPEAALVAIDVARSRERASASNSETASGVLLLLGLFAEVGAIASGDGRAAARIAVDSAAVASDAETSAARSERTIDSLSAAKVSWEAAALRRTTLFPGRGLAAEVYLPINPSVTNLKVGVKVRQESCWFPFRQVVVYTPEPHPMDQ